MKNSPSRIRGFSLLELIVVILIIGIIAAFTIPAASTIIRGSQLTQASQIVIDQFSLARQYALTKNRSVEVRFIKYADKEMPGEGDGSDVSKGSYRAIQTMEVLENGVAVPLDKPQILPQSIIFNKDTLSTLIQGRTEQTPAAAVKNDGTGGDPQMPRGVALNYVFVSFRFRPDGSTDLVAGNPATPSSTTWYVTIHNINEAITGGTPPKNFFTLQIDPVSGVTKKFRPSV